VDIIVCGTGEFAREIYHWIIDAQKSMKIKFKGFLDSNNISLAKFNLDHLYLGNEDDFRITSNYSIIIAIADKGVRENIFIKLNKRKVKFTNFIHPSVKLGGNLKFGTGNIICPNCVFTCDINVGDFNIFNINTTVGHDVRIGGYNTFCSHTDITGNVKIEDGNFLGSRVSLLPNAKIGTNNKIAAGSVIYIGTRNNSLYMGNPAKKIGSNI